MFALADCNNFYASCERLFSPKFNGKPVVVLSNNDGCVIARSNEAKAVGIGMGAPFYQIIEDIKEHKVAVFSSHYTLYGDMSARVMTNIARFSPDIEVYSIDECFFKLEGFDDLNAYATKIRTEVIRNTGIPISIGVAPTKVLAKVANKMAKKLEGVLVLNTPELIENALKLYPVEDLWGIGRQYATKLISMGVETGLQLRQLPLEWVNKNMTIVGVRMWQELWGKSCIPLKSVLEPKKGMCTSRAFGKLTEDFEDLEQASASYASRLAGKLRREKLCASVLSIKLLTNRFNTHEPQYNPSITIPLAQPTNNSIDLIKVANGGLKRIYRKGFRYQKVEVMATGLIPETEVQLNLFNKYNKANDKVSMVMDLLNKHYGDGTIRIASEGINKKWDMKRSFLSPNYTTDWKDIVKVK